MNLIGSVLYAGADPNAIGLALFDASNRGLSHSAENDQQAVSFGDEIDERGIGARIGLHPPNGQFSFIGFEGRDASVAGLRMPACFLTLVCSSLLARYRDG